MFLVILKKYCLKCFVAIVYNYDASFNLLYSFYDDSMNSDKNINFSLKKEEKARTFFFIIIIYKMRGFQHKALSFSKKLKKYIRGKILQSKLKILNI